MGDQQDEAQHRVAGLEEENSRLRRQIEFYRREHHLIGRGLALIILGPALVTSIRAWLGAVSRANPFPIDQTADLAAALIRRILSVGFIGLFFVSILPTWLLWSQTRKLDLQNTLIRQQNVLAEASRRSTLTFEVSSILDEIDEEMDEYGFQRSADFRSGDITLSDFGDAIESLPPNLEVDHEGGRKRLKPISDIGARPRWRDRSSPPRFKVSDRLRGRIAAVSRSLRPYIFLTDDGESTNIPLSPERGQLLLALVQAGVDMEDLNHSSVTFQRAFLEEIDIAGPQASIVDLRHSRLEGAHIRQSNIQADLTYSRLDGANLDGSRLGGKLDATFFKASLRGTRIEAGGGNFCGADLEGAEILEGRYPGNLRYAYVGGVTATDEFLKYAGEQGAVTDRALYQARLETLSDLNECSSAGSN